MKTICKWGMISLCVCASIGLALFVACSDNADEVRNELYERIVVEFQRGVSVEKSTTNGTYLRFESDSVAIKFADYISDHYNNGDEIERIMKPLYDQGFVSRTHYEEANELPLEERYSIGSWGYLVNQDKYFKIGDELYYDENQKKLYAVNEQGEKTLLQDRTTGEDTMLRSVPCYSGGCTID
ncbi:MAG: hypothetical protein LBG59_09150 [Candidatus Peribacteria bacterium]|jgi:hypothetical protein|nr:hypothetical protein [Candidatus Peribacteria bacterium]